MAGSKGNVYEANVLNFLLGGTAFPGALTSTLYWALSSTTYSDAGPGANEISGNGYARLAVARNTTNFPAASGTAPTQILNGTVMSFATATGTQGSIQSAYLMDTSSGGNHVYGFDLTTARTVNSGDTPSFAVGAAAFQED